MKLGQSVCLEISRPCSDMGHVGSKTRSQCQILENSFTNITFKIKTIAFRFRPPSVACCTYSNVKRELLKIFCLRWAFQGPLGPLVLTLIVVTYLFTLLLSIAGDVHPNPGPSESTSFAHLSYSASSLADLSGLGLSIMHINIQSLVPKIDILQVEAQSYDILVFTETWLAANTDCCTIAIQNVDPQFRNDRHGRLGGGVTIYTRSGLQ